MKASHAITVRPATAAAPSPAAALTAPEPTGKLAPAWNRFWFTPADPVGLHMVRFLAGLLLLAWLLPFAGSIDAMFGAEGWFDHQAYADFADLIGRQTDALLRDELSQSVGWSFLFLVWSNPTHLAAAYWASIAVLVLFTLGVCPRFTGVLSWVVVCSFTANPALKYEGDDLLTIFAFYLMLGYLLLGWRRPGQSWPAFLFESPLLGRFRAEDPSVGANLAVRLLQVHLAIVIVTGAMHKLQFADWWAGVALWYWLNPAFETTMAQLRAHEPYGEYYLFGLSLMSYTMLAWQLAFPFFAWRPRWRPLLLGGAVLGWLGLAFIYRLPLLGPIFFVACLSYISPEEWRQLLARLAGLRQGKAAAEAASAKPSKAEAGSLVENHA